MPAVAVTRYSPLPAEALARVSLPLPALASHEVLVEVLATSVNPIDADMAAGYGAHALELARGGPPVVLGREGVGRVVRVGAGVWDYRAGDRVWFAPSPFRAPGTHARFIALGPSELSLAPATLTDAEAAALPYSALTAWAALVDVAAVIAPDTAPAAPLGAQRARSAAAAAAADARATLFNAAAAVAGAVASASATVSAGALGPGFGAGARAAQVATAAGAAAAAVGTAAGAAVGAGAGALGKLGAAFTANNTASAAASFGDGSNAGALGGFAGGLGSGLGALVGKAAAAASHFAATVAPNNNSNSHASPSTASVPASSVSAPTGGASIDADSSSSKPFMRRGAFPAPSISSNSSSINNNISNSSSNAKASSTEPTPAPQTATQPQTQATGNKPESEPASLAATACESEGGVVAAGAPLVLINGGSGPLGRFAVQLLRLHGARVAATCSPRHHASLRALGCEAVLDYAGLDWSRPLPCGPADVLLDCGGADPLQAARALRRGGTYVSVHKLLMDFTPAAHGGRARAPGAMGVAAGAAAAAAAVAELQGRLLAECGVRFAPAVFRPNAAALAHLARLADAGAVTAFVDTTVRSVEAGFELFEGRKRERGERLASQTAAEKTTAEKNATEKAAVESATGQSSDDVVVEGRGGIRTHGGKVVVVPRWD